MSNVDAAWLGMDSPENLMMVTAVLWLEGSLDRERLAEVLGHRLLARYPKFSMRPLPSGTPFEQPVWTDDPDFALGRHLIDAGAVNDDAGLAALVSGLLGTPLDMAHSPWQFHLVSLPGPEGSGRTSAMIARLHHCIADGIALASVLLSLTDDEPDAPPAELHVVDRDPRRPGLRLRLTEGSRDLAPVAGVDPLSPHTIRQALGSLRFGWQVLRTGVGLLLSNRDPRTRLSGRLGTAKAAAWSRPLDLAVVKRVAAALDATVNDVLLAVTAGALRRHLQDSGGVAHDLRIFVPVDLRRDEPVGAALGNKFGIVFVKLPLSVADPLARVRAVHERMSRVKAGPQAASTFALLAIVGALPSWGHRLAVRVLGAKSSAIVTNVPGPTRPVFLAGTRLVRLTFWVPQAGSVGLGVSLLSYSGEVTIGVAADCNLVPDPSHVVAAAEAELADLAARALGVDDGAVVLEAVAFDSDLATTLIAEVQQEYVRRYGGQDDSPIDPEEFAPPDGTFLVATSGATAIGCAGMRRHDDGTVEVKRMFVRPEHRRKGHARRLLAAVEENARAQGFRRVVLETGIVQPEAIALYTSAGYRQVEGFGHYKDSPLSRSFARDL
jgi:diacylglycerol O-acyltransferase / wax synthase